MATKRGAGAGSGRSSKKNKKARSAGSGSKAGASKISSPPSDLILTFGELISLARDNPTVENLRLVSDAASEMERRFNEVHREAELAIKGMEASARLFGDEGGLVADSRLPEPLPPAGVEAPLTLNFIPESARFARFAPGHEEFVSEGGPGGGPQDDGSMKLEAFFTTVVSSVIDAQKDLDRQSLQYARSRVKTAIPPTLYAIPRVQAQIKVGFTDTTSSGFNILLVKNENQDKSFGESTINFDVVAAPPPPGPPDQFTQPIPEFLVAGEELDSLLEASDLKQGAVAGLVAFRLPRKKPDPRTYLILVPLPPGDPASQLRAIHLSETATPGQFTVTFAKTFPGTETALGVLADLKTVQQAIGAWLSSVSV